MERAGAAAARVSPARARGPCSPLLRCLAASSPHGPRISADPHPHFRGPPHPETPPPPKSSARSSPFRSSAGLISLRGGPGSGPRRTWGGEGRIGEAPLRDCSPLSSASGTHGPSHFFFAPLVSSFPACRISLLGSSSPSSAGPALPEPTPGGGGGDGRRIPRGAGHLVTPCPGFICFFSLSFPSVPPSTPPPARVSFLTAE